MRPEDFERRDANDPLAGLRDGAREIDMVINVGRLKSGDDDYVLRDIRAVTEACRDGGCRDGSRVGVGVPIGGDQQHDAEDVPVDGFPAAVTALTEKDEPGHHSRDPHYDIEIEPFEGHLQGQPLLQLRRHIPQNHAAHGPKAASRDC